MLPKKYSVREINNYLTAINVCMYVKKTETENQYSSEKKKKVRDTGKKYHTRKIAVTKVIIISEVL